MINLVEATAVPANTDGESAVSDSVPSFCHNTSGWCQTRLHHQQNH